MTTLYSAKKYAVPALEAHCVEFLKKNLRADNAFMLLTQVIAGLRSHLILAPKTQPQPVCLTARFKTRANVASSISSLFVVEKKTQQTQFPLFSGSAFRRAPAGQSLLGKYRQEHCWRSGCWGLYGYWPRYFFFSSVHLPSFNYKSERLQCFNVLFCADTLVAVLERDTLGVREVRLFGAAVRWAEAEAQRQQLQTTPENKRRVLGKALSLIRFPLMTIEEFAAGNLHK